jgi:hypothetical protein
MNEEGLLPLLRRDKVMAESIYLQTSNRPRICVDFRRVKFLCEVLPNVATYLVRVPYRCGERPVTLLTGVAVGELCPGILVAGEEEALDPATDAEREEADAERFAFCDARGS